MSGLQKVTRAEVAEHKNNKSSWICLNNRVYDVTSFLDEHPGGCEVLLEQAGLDGTEAYEEIGHSSDAQKMAENYLVAEIVDEEKKIYSRDRKQQWSSVTETQEDSDTGMVNAMVSIALLGSVFATIYYFLLY